MSSDLRVLQGAFMARAQRFGDFALYALSRPMLFAVILGFGPGAVIVAPALVFASTFAVGPFSRPDCK
jgi:hypothetical protein